MSAPVASCPMSPFGRHGMQIEAGTVLEDGFVFVCEFCLRTWILSMSGTRVMPRSGLICPDPAGTP